MDAIKKNQLYQLMDDYWDDYVIHRDDPNDIYFIRPSIPIIWFGNIEAYFNSKIRVVTIAINPSDKEFPNSKEKFYRFAGANSFSDKKTLSDKKDKDNLYTVLNNYFDSIDQKKKPTYYSWFNSYERCLSTMKYCTSYHNTNTTNNVAIHIDCFSALATQKYQSLPDSYKKKLNRTDLFTRLFNILDPNLILFSKDFPTFKSVVFDNTQEPAPDFVFPENTKQDNCGKIRSYIVDNKLYIWGRFWQQAFNLAPYSYIDAFNHINDIYDYDFAQNVWKIT